MTTRRYPGIEQRGDGWQAAYRGPDGKERTRTFPKQAEALAWQRGQQAAMTKGEWVDPRAGKVTFGESAEQWRSGSPAVDGGAGGGAHAQPRTARIRRSAAGIGPAQ
jgi:hypothetical protein